MKYNKNDISITMDYDKFKNLKEEFEEYGYNDCLQKVKNSVKDLIWISQGDVYQCELSRLGFFKN